MKKQNVNNSSPELNNCKKEIKNLKKTIALYQEKERRALADYQNLLRQSQQQRAHLIKLANADLLLSILEPLEHLRTASQQLQDQGLEIITNQLWKSLQAIGLEEVEVLNKKFDVNTMEVLDKNAKGEKVIEVLRKAYRLNGEIIQHARVILD
ncbi:MAG: nucleotide exchange factor GrpE [Candidatus Pacebacteria bacterium]|nr:nucleotide exchange factor GrpE [Candidatus Paceibacterota bacterium]